VLKNKRFTVKLPRLPKKITLKSFKFTEFPPQNWLKFALQAVEILAAVVLVFQVLRFPETARELNTWIAAVVIMLMARIVRLLYFGLNALPPVSYDLNLLSAVTIILVVTIFQGGETSYVSLGSTNIWGPGMLMLTGLSLYLLDLVSLNGRVFRALHYTILVAAFLLLSWNLNLTPNASRTFNDLAIAGLMLGSYALASILASRRLLSKILAAAVFVFALPFVILNLTPNLAIVVALTAFIAAVMLIGLEIKQKKNTGIVSRLKSAPWISFALTGTVALIVTLGLSLIVPANGARLASTIQGYGSIASQLASGSELLIGQGLQSSGTPAQNLLTSYGLIGLAAIALALAAIFSKASSLLRASLAGLGAGKLTLGAAAYKATISLGIILLSVDFMFSPLNAPELMGLLLLIVAMFRQPELKVKVATDKEQVVTYKDFFSRKLFSRVMAANLWAELAGTLRLLIAITLIVATPRLIQFVQSLFK
jgi:hypothetical protein